MEKNLFFKSHTETFLNQFLSESCNMSSKEISALNEETKASTVIDLVKTLMNDVVEKIAYIDTTAADKSKGDVKALRNLREIQDAVTQLEEMLSRNDNPLAEAKEYLGRVIKSILFLNQYSNVFKDAYRNKKTLLIMKYQSLILAIISSLSYMISSLVDFSNKDVRLYPDPRLEEIAPLKALKDFNKSVESGEFKIITRDVNILREYFLEIPVETMSELLEATEVLPMIIDGIKTFSKNLDTSKVSNMVYKATGVVLLLLSVREIIYTLSKTKVAIGDMIENITSFANVNLGSSLSKMLSFNRNFKAYVESGSDMADREIEDENRKIATNVKFIQSNPISNEPVEVSQDAEPAGDFLDLGF